MLQQGRQNQLGPRQYIVVPEAQHGEAAALQPGIAATIAGIVEMLAAVNFNNHPRRQTHEIDDVLSDDLLAFELVAGEAACAELAPEKGFRFGLLGAELACKRQCRTPDHPSS